MEAEAKNLSANCNARASIVGQMPSPKANLDDPHSDMTFDNDFQKYDWWPQTRTSYTSLWNGVMTGCPSGSTLR